jgi:hypothetical protein
MGREQLAETEAVAGVEGRFEVSVAKFCFFLRVTRVSQLSERDPRAEQMFNI